MVNLSEGCVAKTKSSHILKAAVCLYFSILVFFVLTVDREILYGLRNQLVFLFYASQYWPIALLSLYLIVKSWPFKTFPNPSSVLPFRWRVSEGSRARITGVVFIFLFVLMTSMPFIKYQRHIYIQTIYHEIKKMEDSHFYLNKLDGSGREQ